MKRILGFGLIFFIVIASTTGCGYSDNSHSGNAQEESEPMLSSTPAQEPTHEPSAAVSSATEPVLDQERDQTQDKDTIVSPNVPITEDSQETSRVEVEQALQLYLEYINDLRNTAYLNDFYGSLSLVFINDDDIPELVIDRSYPYNGVIICTVSNGAVQTILAEGGGGGINYIEKGNKFTYVAIIQDTYFDTVCCIEDGVFVILHEGSRNAAGNQWFWDGEAVSVEEYFGYQTAAFNVYKSEYTGMSSIRAADMIYALEVELSDSPPSIAVVTHDQMTGLLTSDGAFITYNTWLKSHPDAPLISRQSMLIEYLGEQYYHFPARYTYMYFYNILVHIESGELLNMLIEDGMDGGTHIEPLDDWYNRNR